MRPRRHRSFAAFTALALASGCAHSENPASESAEPQRNFTDPVALVQAHAEALTALDYDRYAALLSPDFEYVPQEEDWNDFPWIPPGIGDPWDLEAELGMIGHMMDSTFVSSVTNEAIDSMEMLLTVTNQRAVPGGVEVTCNADIQVLWTPHSGAYTSVRLIFTLVADEDGFLRIVSIVELPAFGRVEPNSWANIKASYR